LEARTEDVVKSLDRLEGKVDNLIDRISRVEAQHQSLRESVRNEILADVKAEVAVVKFALGRYPLDGVQAALLSPKDDPA
jgi:hypothetical protein